MRFLAVAGGVAAVALAAGLTAALRAAPPTSAALSPVSAVTGALERTAARSYTFTVQTTVRDPTTELNSVLVSGAYDPGQRLGAEELTESRAGQVKRAQVRFIGAYLYTSVPSSSGFGKPWDKSSLATAAGPAANGPYGFASDQVISPSGLIVVLRLPGTTVRDSGPASGPGWTGARYTFAARDGQATISGTVDVDQQGRARRMTITTDDGVQPITTTDRDISFGDFTLRCGSALHPPARRNTPPADPTGDSTSDPRQPRSPGFAYWAACERAGDEPIDWPGLRPATPGPARPRPATSDAAAPYARFRRRRGRGVHRGLLLIVIGIR